MNGDLLLYWMSRLGKGSWQRFVEALKELDQEGDLDLLKVRLPGRLSDLSHVDFSRSSHKWKVRRPVLAGLVGTSNTAILCGARSERLIESFEKAARLAGCEPTIEPVQDMPCRILLAGNDEVFAQVEKTTGISFSSSYALQLLSTAVPVLHKLALAQPEKGTLNWAVKIFDFATRAWVHFTERLEMISALPPMAALELKSEYETKYCVVGRDRTLRKLPRHDVVYAAASLQSLSLLQYNIHERLLSTPATAPMPEVYTRIASLCSGKAASWKDRRLLYERVPPVVAMTLAVLVGQQHPGFSEKD